MFSFFTGRSGRQEYWISVGLLIVAAFVLSALRMEAASAAITIMWVITWLRRLHDIGKPGWIALIPVALMFIAIMIGLALGGQPFLNAIVALESMNTNAAIPDRVAYLIIGVGLVAVICQFGFTIWLGVRKGDPGQNRFGPPPEAIVKRD
ncbi:MAG: DUF805 domain-containing protein [Rhizomicrobium sp.]